MTMTTAQPTIRPGGGRRRQLTIAGSTALVLALIAVGVYVWHARTATPSVPYADPAVAGHLTLCSAQGAAVTKGSLDEPLAATVVGDLAAAGGYAAQGRTATLYAYQPRTGVTPPEWTGLQLNAPTPYADPEHPTAAVNAQSTTIGQFVRGYPATDGGWVQLRLVVSAPGQPDLTTTYAAGDLHLRGSSWTLADPGTAGCS